MLCLCAGGGPQRGCEFALYYISILLAMYFFFFSQENRILTMQHIPDFRLFDSALTASSYHTRDVKVINRCLLLVLGRTA